MKMYPLYREKEFILTPETLNNIRIRNLQGYIDNSSAKRICIVCVEYDTGRWCSAQKGDMMYIFDRQLFKR